jgi:hypothetical protein
LIKLKKSFKINDLQRLFLPGLAKAALRAKVILSDCETAVQLPQ